MDARPNGFQRLFEDRVETLKFSMAAKPPAPRFSTVLEHGEQFQVPRSTAVLMRNSKFHPGTSDARRSRRRDLSLALQRAVANIRSESVSRANFAVQRQMMCAASAEHFKRHRSAETFGQI